MQKILNLLLHVGKGSLGGILWYAFALHPLCHPLLWLIPPSTSNNFHLTIPQISHTCG